GRGALVFRLLEEEAHRDRDHREDARREQRQQPPGDTLQDEIEHALLPEVVLFLPHLGFVPRRLAGVGLLPVVLVRDAGRPALVLGRVRLLRRGVCLGYDGQRHFNNRRLRGLLLAALLKFRREGLGRRVRNGDRNLDLLVNPGAAAGIAYLGADHGPQKMWTRLRVGAHEQFLGPGERPVVLQGHALAALVEELRLALCYRPQRREGVGALVSQRRQAQQLLALGALRQGVGVVALFRSALNGQKERFAALEFFRCGAGGVLLRERVF